MSHEATGSTTPDPDLERLARLEQAYNLGAQQVSTPDPEQRSGRHAASSPDQATAPPEDRMAAIERSIGAIADVLQNIQTGGRPSRGGPDRGPRQQRSGPGGFRGGAGDTAPQTDDDEPVVPEAPLVTPPTVPPRPEITLTSSSLIDRIAALKAAADAEATANATADQAALNARQAAAAQRAAYEASPEGIAAKAAAERERVAREQEQLAQAALLRNHGVAIANALTNVPREALYTAGQRGSIGRGWKISPRIKDAKDADGKKILDTYGLFLRDDGELITYVNAKGGTPLAQSGPFSQYLAKGQPLPRVFDEKLTAYTKDWAIDMLAQFAHANHLSI